MSPTRKSFWVQEPMFSSHCICFAKLLVRLSLLSSRPADILRSNSPHLTRSAKGKPLRPCGLVSNQFLLWDFFYDHNWKIGLFIKTRQCFQDMPFVQN